MRLCVRFLLSSLPFALLIACTPKAAQPTEADASIAAPPWSVAEPEPAPRPGMMWIPAGILIAGTPPDKLPRVADEEMAGEQVVMHGFYIDVFPYPNEAGAIPTTNLSWEDAKKVCEDQKKRLCTELEVERACKGPNNTTYEYGDVHKPAVCQTGVVRSLFPNGVNATCVSGFGVHDLHGGVWTWTSSHWNRDANKTGLIAVRGGNGPASELVGRCANGRGVKPEPGREDVGVRCCAGEVNAFEVVLSVTRGQPLKWQPPDDKIAPLLEELIPDDIKEATKSRKPDDRFKVDRLWIWHPLGNEELVAGGGCAHVTDAPPVRKGATSDGSDKACGVIVARMHNGVASQLAWVPSDWWQPTLSEGSSSAREVYVNGGDRNGAFRKLVTYAWGRIVIGEKERKKKHKGEREPRY